MRKIYGVHSFNTYTTLFTKRRQIKEKHLFSIEYGVFQIPSKILDRDNT